MSRPVDVVVTVDLDLVVTGRPVTSVYPARWNPTSVEVSERDVEHGTSLLLDALGHRLADVTGELDLTDLGENPGGGVQR